jgi:hypothetical protein
MESSEFILDEATGSQRVDVWVGMKGDVETFMFGLAVLEGVRAVSRRRAGPVYEAVVTWAGVNDGEVEPAVDKWGLRTEFAQEDIRGSPNIIALAGGDDALAAFWYRDNKEALKEGEEPEGNPDVDPGQMKLWRLMARGAEAYETKRHVLRRTRVIPVNHATPAEVNAVEVIYTTAQLVARYGVPQGFARKLPPNPDITPEDTMWGWRERTNDSEFDWSTGKVMETYEWLFAPWSTVLYNPF